MYLNKWLTKIKKKTKRKKKKTVNLDSLLLLVGKKNLRWFFFWIERKFGGVKIKKPSLVRGWLPRLNQNDCVDYKI